MQMQPHRGPTPKRLHLGSLSHRQPSCQLQMQALRVLMRNKPLRSSLYRTALNPQLQSATADHHAWRDCARGSALPRSNTCQSRDNNLVSVAEEIDFYRLEVS